jgi:hypothetical protein
VHRQVIAEDISQCVGRRGVQAPEEVSVQLGNAINQQGTGMTLIGQPTEHDGRQVATIDRQPGLTRQ